jgi:phosphoribosyl 1,2-cyclic phosphodiesterase
MSLTVASLNSGSNGNCYYVGNDADALLVDAGLSCREIEKRLSRLSLEISKVRALFITHEHADHISALPRLALKYKLPVFISAATALRINLSGRIHTVQPMVTHQQVRLGSLTVVPFPTRHDAVDSHGFRVMEADAESPVSVGFFTDIGIPCEHVIHHFRQCHAAFLETNYDELMLENGSYPAALKNRIRGGMGHLSNTQALQLFRQFRPGFMTHLFLSHLSEHNNSPDLVMKLFRPHAGNTIISVASRYRESKVYIIQNRGKINADAVISRPSFSYQLELFR